ncbi:hypothetical protein K1W54_32735 [Micromonospora sp. CPCC 205371]|nr:hypothetical protein [Micromonospora sp. CPCC 205371]
MELLRNRRVLLGAGVASVVVALAALGLGSANADSVPDGNQSVGRASAPKNTAARPPRGAAARTLLEAPDAARDAGQNVARACEDADTQAGQDAAAAGREAVSAAMDAEQTARQLLAASRGDGSAPNMLANAEGAFTAAQQAMQLARTAVSDAQAAVAANPNARRGAGRMLNGAVEDLDDGGAEMQQARQAITNAESALSRN